MGARGASQEVKGQACARRELKGSGARGARRELKGSGARGARRELKGSGARGARREAGTEDGCIWRGRHRRSG